MLRPYRQRVDHRPLPAHHEGGQTQEQKRKRVIGLVAVVCVLSFVRFGSDNMGRTLYDMGRRGLESYAEAFQSSAIEELKPKPVGEGQLKSWEGWQPDIHEKMD